MYNDFCNLCYLAKMKTRFVQLITIKVCFGTCVVKETNCSASDIAAKYIDAANGAVDAFSCTKADGSVTSLCAATDIATASSFAADCTFFPWLAPPVFAWPIVPFPLVPPPPWLALPVFAPPIVPFSMVAPPPPLLALPPLLSLPLCLRNHHCLSSLCLSSRHCCRRLLCLRRLCLHCRHCLRRLSLRRRHCLRCHLC